MTQVTDWYGDLGTALAEYGRPPRGARLPIGRDYACEPKQAAFHVRAFLTAGGGLGR